MFSVGIMAVAVVLFTGISADWSSTREILTIMLFGFGFGLGMPALTDTVMAAVPVEDAGVGSAVNDVSRELGSAFGVAIIGTFISSIYRSNVDDRLGGQVPDEIVETAKEGIGVVAGASQSLPVDLASTTFEGASAAFVEAMNSGFWFSAAVLGSAVVIAGWLLPNKARTEQVERPQEVLAGPEDPFEDEDPGPKPAEVVADKVLVAHATPGFGLEDQEQR